MGLREAHRHVEVGAAGFVRGVEDRHVEPRVARVHDRVDPLCAREFDDRGSVRRVDRGRDEPLVGDLVAGRLGAGERDIGDHRALEEVAAGEADGDRVADAAGADDEDAHRLSYRNWSV